jgi:hypothetical protein
MIRVTGQRQCRQPQPGRPPLGPLVQQRHPGVRQRDPRRSQQRAGFPLGKPQVRRADLGQLAGQPQPLQPQPQIVARQSAFPFDSDVSEQRRLLAEFASAQPLPPGVTVTAAALGGVPTAEITIDGATMDTKRAADPLFTPEAFPPRVADYTAGHDAALGLISPIFADLSGLPPLIIQAGTHEVLLDDALRLARQAATADVQVTLDITPGVPHVFQAYYPILDEAAAALDRAGQLLSAHLASAERVTA